MSHTAGRCAATFWWLKSGGTRREQLDDRRHRKGTPQPAALLTVSDERRDAFTTASRSIQTTSSGIRRRMAFRVTLSRFNATVLRPRVVRWQHVDVGQFNVLPAGSFDLAAA